VIGPEGALLRQNFTHSAHDAVSVRLPCFKGALMTDIAFVGLSVLFFVLSAAYVEGLRRL
jgi:hypothetical protein